MNRIGTIALLLGLSVVSQLINVPGAARAQDISSTGLEGYYIGGTNLLEPFRTQGSGWTTTSSGSSGLGRPAVLTWSVARDGTELPTGLGEPVSDSSLISFLDGIHHGGASPGGDDLTQRDWWQLMNSAFERWDELSGLTFNYEPNDDGRKVGTSGGQLGIRGDYRIGGHPIDGQTSPTFLAYNFFPNNADMVIDTDEENRWGNSLNNYLLFRNMMMHEIGHGVGLNHVESVDVNPNKADFQFGTFLMEPTLASGFDGPQFDDILGVHRLYGDRFEEGSGNDAFFTATVLGQLLPGNTISIGTDAVDTFVGTDEYDFVSIDDDSDVDFFRFSIDVPQVVNITLTPMGPTYDEGGGGSGDNGTQQPFIASAKSNLTLTLLDTNGTSVLEFSNDTGLGLAETITNYALPQAGDYYVRVGGFQNTAQFFQLDINSVPEPVSLLMLAIGIGCSGLARRRQRG